MSAYTNDNIRYYYTPDGKLSFMVYGNGEFEYDYTYDELGRLIEESYYYEVTEEWEEDGEIYYDWYEVIEPIKKYEYTADGKLYRVYDALNDEYTHYSYDINGRLEHIIQYNGDKLNDFSVNYSYRMTAGKEHMVHMQHYFFNYAVGTDFEYGQIRTIYRYNDDDSLQKLEISSGGNNTELTYTYDDFKRPSTITVTSGNFSSETTYGYKTTSGVTTGEVENYTVEIGNVTNAYTYEYDHRGNIIRTELNGDLQYEFYYDDLGQLEYEENYITGDCCSYEYDDAGNIVLRTDGIGCDEYHYEYASSPYGDRLVSYNGEAITYDSYGRTTFYRGKAITYYEYDFNRIQSIGGTSFTYDAEGMRKSKTVGGVTHTYYYDGLNLIKEEWGNNTLVFLYDASGSPIGMQYRNSSKPAGDWDTYYYEKNLQGDIVAVYSATGTKLVAYDYDAWGDISYTTYYNGGASTAAAYNPLRYRGYYYDDDFDLYYLATRYYDPEVCRFITADSYVSTGQGILGYNRYAYCGNNPVMRVDPTGEFWSIIAAVVLSVFIGANVGTIIASEMTVADKSIEPMSDEQFNAIESSGDTSGLTLDEQLAYVRKYRINVLQDDNLDNDQIVDNWSEADMMREIVYHDRAYRLLEFVNMEKTSFATRLKYVNFETEQDFTTYVRRMFGNLMFW